MRVWTVRARPAFLILLGGATSLAACNSEGPANEQTAPTMPPANTAAAQTSSGPQDGNAGQPAAPAEPEAAAIPAAFHGRWAETAAACDSPGHVSRLTISASELRFHESLAAVRQVELLGPREINVHVAATGEGTNWLAEYHYSLDAAGDTLTDEAGGGMVRTRCAS